MKAWNKKKKEWMEIKFPYIWDYEIATGLIIINDKVYYARSENFGKVIKIIGEVEDLELKGENKDDK